jgi:hypothetical protein
MKRIGSIAAIALLAAASAYAQTQYEPAIPRGIPDSSVQPSRELSQPSSAAPAAQVVEPVVPQLVMDPKRGHSDADARQCLQFASNTQIHRCAERYRAHAARRASVTRTKAAKPAEAIAPSARAKAADLGKPDLSKAAEPAKPVDMKAAPATAKSAPIERPAATAKAAPSATPIEKSAPPKWTDSAKDTMKSRGDRLPQ